MDRLKLAWQTVGKAAKDKRKRGEIPTFLGAKGMLALMYDRIVAYNKQEGDHVTYLLDLAVSALFAFADALPEIEEFDSLLEDDVSEGDYETEESDSDANEDGTEEDEKVDPNDTRWTTIPVGKSIKDVK